VGSPGLCKTPCVKVDRPAAADVELLAAVAVALAPALTANEVAAAVFDRVLPAIGSGISGLWRTSADGAALEMVGASGVDSTFIDPYVRVPLDAHEPVAMAARDREAIFVHSIAERDKRWPELRKSPPGVEAIAVLPLLANERLLGCLSLGFPAAREWTDDERTLLTTVAAQCALAIDRSRLHEQVRRTAERARILTEITAVLTESAEPDELPQRLVDACVPELADWCSLHMAEGSLLRRVGLAVRDRPDLTVHLVDRFPMPVSADSPVAAAFRTGRVRQYPKIKAEMIEAATPDAEFRALLEELTVDNAIAIPVFDHDQCLGVLTFAFRDATRSYDADLVGSLEQLATRTGNALSRVARFGRQRAIVAALQRVVLPSSLPDIAGHAVAARYVTAGDGDVGGDWWDVLVQPDARVALSVGDVAGHGLGVASTMGQLRVALRTFLIDGRNAGAALDSLSNLLRYTEPDAMATVVVAAYNPTDRVVSWANAGHPPMLLTAPGEEPRYLVRPSAPPLGLGRVNYAMHAASLPPGFRLYLFTDGLVEGRRSTLDEGMARLAATVARLDRRRDLSEHCEELIAAMAMPKREDDVTVVALSDEGETGDAQAS
jgi:GAF domain-containing protein